MKYVPCPTCDLTAELRNSADGKMFWYRCDHCELTGAHASTMKGAEALWIMAYFGEGLKACPNCKHTKFWVGHHGWPVCDVCHPVIDEKLVVVRVVSGPLP